MSQYKCPITSCGRILQNVSVLKEHLQRRHPNVNIETYLPKNQQQRVMQQQINKLPKLKNLKLQEGQYKLPQVYRRSSSKNKKEIMINGGLNKSKIVAVIGQSKKVVENTENSHGLKRPSLNKKNSSTILNHPNQRLPQLRPANKVKLQKLSQGHLKLAKQHKNQIQVNSMNITAPNFKNLIRKEISSRQRSTSKKCSTPKIQETTQQIKDKNDLMFIKTQEGFNDKLSKLHKHIQKRQYVKKKSQLSKQSSQKLEQSPKKQQQHHLKKQQQQNANKTINQNQIVSKVLLKKEDKLTAKNKSRRQFPQRNIEKKEMHSLDQYNFDERIIVFKSNVGPKLTFPPSNLQFLFANNCKLTSLNLTNLQNLRQLSLQHNSIKELSFLNYQNNISIQKIFLDHNQLTTLDYLPPYLQVLSISFNNIVGLQINTRQLSKINTLKEIDFSFNPIRKESNYKLHVIGNCFQLKKIDGIKITKFDLQLAAQYNKIVDQELGLVPSNRLTNLIISKCSNSPSTEISYGEAQIQQPQSSKQSQQLQRQIQKLQKIIKTTKNHMNIIHEQNEIIKNEIMDLKQKCEQFDDNPQVLYQKLRNQCAALELLNFLQYASQQQLEQIIIKKKRQLSVA